MPPVLLFAIIQSPCASNQALYASIEYQPTVHSCSWRVPASPRLVYSADLSCLPACVRGIWKVKKIFGKTYTGHYGGAPMDLRLEGALRSQIYFQMLFALFIAFLEAKILKRKTERDGEMSVAIRY